MQKVDPQAGRQLSLAVECEEWVVHRVGILARDAAGGLVRVERAAVAMRGDTQLRVVLKGAERGPFSRLGSEKLLAESLERELAGRRGLSSR